MKMKLRVLTDTSKGKLLSIASTLASNSDYKADIIPPAYPCERERLVIIVFTAKGKTTTTFDLFAKSLDKSRAQNVAFIVDGDAAKAEPVINMIKEAGTNVIDDVLYINGGLPFKFMKKVSAEESARVEEWFQGVLKKLA
ncbi:MAG: hypothetical protein IJW71_01995 [Clostridia bacterium]|nr:hypothetical protein [Clostridia bacterium]